MTFRRWDIVSVPFPLVEGDANRRRPALIVSTDAFHLAHRACFGAMITTFEWSDRIRRAGTLHDRERGAVEGLLQRWFGA